MMYMLTFTYIQLLCTISKTMKKIILLIILFNIKSYSQENHQNEIFKIIDDYESRTGYTLYSCTKLKTSFNKKDLLEKTDKIPVRILNEISDNSINSVESVWDDKLFKQKLIKKCFDENNYNAFRNKNNDKNPILYISEPIFDSTKKHCIVSVEYKTHGNMNYGTSYLLKKTYGLWSIITDFNVWMK